MYFLLGSGLAMMYLKRLTNHPSGRLIAAAQFKRYAYKKQLTKP